MSLGHGVGKPEEFLKFGHGNYFYGYSVERQFYNDVLGLPDNSFPKDAVLTRFVKDSRNLDTPTKKFIMRAIENFGE